MIENISTYLSSSTEIVTAGQTAVLPKALIILGGMVVIAVTIFLVGWGLRKLFKGLEVGNMQDFGVENYKELDSLHSWEKGGRLN